MPASSTPAVASTQKYLNILAIRDGMVILRDGGIRTILEVGSLNFALKSEDEQNGMLYQYQQFLNSLKFPIQIVMQSRRLDLYTYLKMLKELLEKQTNDLIRIQTEEYINYIERLLTKANIMDKKFYVVIPFFPGGVEKATMVDRVLGAGSKSGEVHFTKEQFAEYKKQLDERVNVISGGLGSMGLRVSPLDTQQIIELLYVIYNPAEAMSERMTEVSNLESEVIKTDMPVMMASADAAMPAEGAGDGMATSQAEVKQEEPLVLENSKMTNADDGTEPVAQTNSVPTQEGMTSETATAIPVQNTPANEVIDQMAVPSQINVTPAAVDQQNAAPMDSAINIAPAVDQQNAAAQANTTPPQDYFVVQDVIPQQPINGANQSIAQASQPNTGQVAVGQEVYAIPQAVQGILNETSAPVQTAQPDIYAANMTQAVPDQAAFETNQDNFTNPPTNS